MLTVRPGQPASHRGTGWETVTAQAISALSARGGPLVAVLWGRQAQSLAPLLGDGGYYLELERRVIGSYKTAVPSAVP